MKSDSRTKLLNAAITVVRAKGFSATRIEDICAEASVTKGSFFHHFESKDHLAASAIERWNERAAGVFAGALFLTMADPVDRVLGYLEFRKAQLSIDVVEFVCFVGTMVHDVYRTKPDLNAACAQSLNDGITYLEAQISEAMKQRGLPFDWSARSLADHIESVVQGGFVLAKATDSAAAAFSSLEHLQRYISTLFSHEMVKAT